MARVTIIIEDVVSGAMDGSVSVHHMYEPELDLRGTLAEAMERLSPAQAVALNVKAAVEESHRLVRQEILASKPGETP